MTEDRLPLAELMAKAGDGDFLRSVAESDPAPPRELRCGQDVMCCRQQAQAQRQRCWRRSARCIFRSSSRCLVCACLNG
jgi:hypothetical protein